MMRVESQKVRKFRYLFFPLLTYIFWIYTLNSFILFWTFYWLFSLLSYFSEWGINSLGSVSMFLLHNIMLLLTCQETSHDLSGSSDFSWMCTDCSHIKQVPVYIYIPCFCNKCILLKLMSFSFSFMCFLWLYLNISFVAKDLIIRVRQMILIHCY